MLLVIGRDQESDWDCAMGDCSQQLFNLSVSLSDTVINANSQTN